LASAKKPKIKILAGDNAAKNIFLGMLKPDASLSAASLVKLCGFLIDILKYNKNAKSMGLGRKFSYFE